MRIGQILAPDGVKGGEGATSSTVCELFVRRAKCRRGCRDPRDYYVLDQHFQCFADSLPGARPRNRAVATRAFRILKVKAAKFGLRVEAGGIQADSLLEAWRQQRIGWAPWFGHQSQHFVELFCQQLDRSVSGP